MSHMQPVDPSSQPPHARPESQSWPAAQPAWRGPQIRTDQRPISVVLVVVAWVLTLFTLGYLLPWAIAESRGRSNHGAVGLINFFLGWSLIGWVVALVMACQSHQVVGGHTTVVVAQNFAPAPSYDTPSYATPSHDTPSLDTAPRPLAAPGPGWYLAPDGSGQQFWDGAAWTEHRAP